MSSLIRNIPGEFGVVLRGKWYTKRFKRVGHNLRILQGVFILNPEKIECRDNVSFGVCNYIQAGGGFVVESDVMLGPYVRIWTQTHNYRDPEKPIWTQGYSFSPVRIGRDVWIGANAFVMPGADIGERCIVSAGSVVGGKVYPPGIILAGYPARKIGARSNGK